MDSNNICIKFCTFLLSVAAFTSSCAGFAVDEQADTCLEENPGCPIVMYEKGMPCFPCKLKCIGPDGAINDLSSMGLEALASGPQSDGTWIYSGETAQGTATAIVHKNSSSPLPEKRFGSTLEIAPKTHPIDIRPSSDKTAQDALFRFSVLDGGKQSNTTFSYSASRVGRIEKTGSTTDQAVINGKTSMGTGVVRIDEPGIWWITVESGPGSEKPTFASITFRVPGKPGPDHYSAFTSSGDILENPASVAAFLADAQVVFIGEMHDDPVAHVLEKELFAAIHRLKGDVALSMEMFERDVQPVLSGYLDGLYTESHFLDAARPWPAYASDYKPCVEYARENDLPVIAANAPRRLVNLVSRKGPEALALAPDQDKKWLPPIPYHIPKQGRYVEKQKEVFSAFDETKKEGSSSPGPRLKREWIEKGCPDLAAYNESLSSEKKMGSGGAMPPHVMMRMMEAMKKGGNPAQSLWDASMAFSIASFLEDNPETTVVNINGAFHSNEHLGTVDQLMRYRPNTRVAVISLVPHESFPAFDPEELSKLGEVIIVTDPSWQPNSDK